MQSISLIGSPGGGGTNAPMLYILERSRQADVKFELTCNSATYNFRDIHG